MVSTKLLSIILLVVSARKINGADAGCDDGWSAVGNKCVQYYNNIFDLKSWDVAKGLCEGLSGKLFMPKCLQELTDAETNTGVSGINYWVGATDAETEDEWLDLYGQAITYTEWEKSNALLDKDCAYIKTNNKLNHALCTSPKYYACEKDRVATPAVCIETYTNIDGVCYKSFTTEQLNFADAKAACATENGGTGFLLKINTDHEKEAIFGSGGIASWGYYWIDYQKNAEAKYVNSDGVELAMTESGLLFNTRDCVYVGPLGGVRTWYCSKKKSYICGYTVIQETYTSVCPV